MLFRSPTKETTILKPISPYGESKKQSENFCKLFCKKTGTPISILRFYTVYGPRQRPDEAFTKFIRLILNEKPVTIYGDGNQERDFTYVSDIVSGTILAALRGNGIYNLGTNNPVSVNHILSIIEKCIGMKVKKDFTNLPIGDVPKTHADISKAKEELDYHPQISFKDGIKNCINWCKQTHNI